MKEIKATNQELKTKDFDIIEATKEWVKADTDNRAIFVVAVTGNKETENISISAVLLGAGDMSIKIKTAVVEAITSDEFPIDLKYRLIRSLLGEVKVKERGKTLETATKAMKEAGASIKKKQSDRTKLN